MPHRRALFAALLPLAAQAQQPPARALRLLVPFAPGGTTDILARALAERLSAARGEPVIVDNRAGGGGLVAGESFARAEPDGRTLLVATASLVSINKALYSTLPFDPDQDFAPVVMLAQQPNILVINPKVLPVTSLAGLLDYARAHPGALSFGSSGIGSQMHLTGEMLRAAAGLDLTHIPYRGSGPAMADLIAGTIPMMFDGLGSSLPQIQAGSIRAIATCGPAESPALPGVPALASVFPGFSSMNWTCLFALRSTPAPIRAALAAETRAALASPPMQKLFAERFFEPFPLTEPQLEAFLADEAVRWREAVRRSGATAN